MAPRRSNVLTFLKEELRIRSLLLYAIVFLLCFGTAKFGQYLFYDLNTSPALIWAPFGIALGAILVGGYRMWLPIALAELLSVYTTGISPLPIILAATVGQTLQPVVGAWAMQKLKFDTQLSRIMDAFILIGVAVCAATIAPTLLILVQLSPHVLVGGLEVTWIRNWTGGMFSILILTPLIITWLPPRPLVLTRFEFLETCTALIILAALLIFLSWTPYGAAYSLTGIYILLGLFAWMSLRMEPRVLTLGIVIFAALGIGGSFYQLQSSPTFNTTLFGQELVIEFLAVIFIVFAALIEERRRARAALERNVRQLQEALQRIESEDVAKNQFIATLAHELRNPLAPVVSALDLLSLQSPSPEAMQTIEGAQRELNVMRRLLDDILDVARISQTRFRLQREVVDVRQLLERCVESTRYFLRSRKHTLTVSLPDQAIPVDVDPVRFEQIVVNLLNNAGKYTPSGGKVELLCETVGEFAVVTVRDNGVGIPQESLDEVFEPFRQIRPTPQIGTGLGIGLWLTKRLVEMHDGRIEARSEGRERGSSFSIFLPLRDGAIIGPSAKRKTTTPIIPPFKILIVDDNEAAAQAMQKLLKLKGHEARLAYSGKAGFTAALDFSPRVILLDIGLPDMSGYDLARMLREQGSRATLIALTGFGQEEDKKNAKNAGFDFHLTKPVGIADIETLLGQISL